MAGINTRINLSKSQILATLIAFKMVRVHELWSICFELTIVIFNLKTSYLFNILEECGPTERHVSPDKLYRAALLKSRFADTILKAREKTLTQVGYAT